MHKPFSIDQYDQDDDAKHAVIALFLAWNCDVRVNHDHYGIDLIGRDLQTREMFGVEVEVKHNWCGPTFPFDTVHYSARKMKYLYLPTQTYFCTVNTERTHCMILNLTGIEQCKLVRKQTNVTASEWFMEFPTHLFDTYKL